MHHFAWTPNSREQVKKLDPDIQRVIIKKLEYFASTASPLSFAKRLKNFHSGQYRFRIGDYRVIFDVQKDTMLILAIGNRRDIYK